MNKLERPPIGAVPDPLVVIASKVMVRVNADDGIEVIIGKRQACRVCMDRNDLPVKPKLPEPPVILCRRHP